MKSRNFVLTKLFKMTKIKIALIILCVLAIVPGVSAQYLEMYERDPYTYRQQLIDSLIQNMVKVDGGAFMLGVPIEDKEAFDWEKPAKEHIVNDFYICRYEVTQALWEVVVGVNPACFKIASHPIESVSYYDCLFFISCLNKLTHNKYNFRLPTEQEWEYAARGGKFSQCYKFSGSDDLNEIAVYCKNANGMPDEVGTKKPNELGLYDMTGNVWEWTSSYWTSDYNSDEDRSSFVTRGGSWINDEGTSRVTYRSYVIPQFKDYYLGLRLVCDNI